MSSYDWMTLTPPGALKILEATSGMPRSRGGLVCQLVLMGLAVAGANKVRRRLL